MRHSDSPLSSEKPRSTQNRRAFFVCLAGLALGFQSASATTYYSADFDNTNPGKKELQGGQIDVVDNPFKDATNNSAKVGRCRVLEGGRRAEYSTSRLPTQEKRYVYRWMYYIPADFVTADLGWRVLSQWKTYPCEVCTNYGDEICGGCGGIFNEMRVTSGNFEFNWRAKPDCREYHKPLVTGRWISFMMEILWTNSTNGYAKLWVDGVQVADHKNIKTLFDRFPSDGSCDIYWGVGLYGPLRGRPYTDIYIDNISITDETVPVVTPPDPVTPPAGTQKLAIAASSAGAEQTGNTSVKSHDGDLSTRWANDNTLANSWITYDLGTVKTVNALKLQLNNGATRTFPLKIEVGDQTFTEVWHGTTITTPDPQTIITTEATGRYVRVTMTAANSDGTYWFSIIETEVWGKNAPTTPTVKKLEYSQSQWSANVSTGAFLITSPLKGDFDIILYDTRGKPVSTVYSGFLSLGTQRHSFSGIPAGMYILFVRQKPGNEIFRKNLTVLN